MRHRGRVLIHAYSYEDRSVAAIEQMRTLGYQFDQILSLNYTSRQIDLAVAAESNHRRAKQVVKQWGIPHRTLRIDPYSQIEAIDEIAAVIGSDPVELTVDITSLTKLHVLRLLHRFYGRIRYVTYVGAAGHRPMGSVESLGHSKCVPVLGFEGRSRLSAARVLIAVLGFEGDRALSSYLELAPSRAVGVVGVPWVSPGRAVEYIQAALDANTPFLSHHNVAAELAPSLSATAFASRLRDIICEYQARFRSELGEQIGFRIILLGTKIQALGAYFLWTRHPEVRLWYSVPVEYKQMAIGAGRLQSQELREYSDPDPDVWERIYRRPRAKAR